MKVRIEFDTSSPLVIIYHDDKQVDFLTQIGLTITAGNLPTYITVSHQEEDHKIENFLSEYVRGELRREKIK